MVARNKWFFTAFAAFLVLGALGLIFIPQGNEILFFSNYRSLAGDYFFRFITRLGEGVAFLAVFLLLLAVHYRHSLLVLATGLAVMGLSYLGKQFFAHDRPVRFFKKIDKLDEINLVDGVELASGATSFPSGHTFAAFALFTLLALLAPQKRWLALLFFTLALLVAISRIYLVQHFLKDVYVGAILGVILAAGGYQWGRNRRETE